MDRKRKIYSFLSKRHFRRIVSKKTNLDLLHCISVRNVPIIDDDHIQCDNIESVENDERIDFVESDILAIKSNEEEEVASNDRSNSSDTSSNESNDINSTMYARC